MKYLLLLLILFFNPVSAQTVTIGADYWYPMNGHPESVKPGYMIELAKRLLESSGYVVEYKIMPWERAVLLTRKGRLDCVVGAYKSDTPDFIFPASHWGYDQPGFYVKKGSAWHYAGLNSLSSIRLGVIGGYYYDDDFDAYVRDNKLGNVFIGKGEKALEQNIRKILLDRIQVTIESVPVMEAKLKELSLEKKLIHAGALSSPVEMYLACSPAKPKQSQDLVNIIDRGMPRLRTEGVLEQIMNKYGLSDWL